jgi:hypothetical protein
MGISIDLMGREASFFKHFRNEVKFYLTEIASQNPAARFFQPGVTGALDRQWFPEKLMPLELHSLRRYAAHLELNQSQPPVPMKDLDRRSLRADMEHGQLTPENFQAILTIPGVSKAYFSKRDFYRGDPLLEKIYLGDHPANKYPHLIGRADYITGYYFPLEFGEPLAVNQQTRADQAGIGSSQRLLMELNELNLHLQAPEVEITDIQRYDRLLGEIVENDPWSYEKAAWMIIQLCAKESVTRNLIIGFG